jgi:hypothetical protein
MKIAIALSASLLAGCSTMSAPEMTLHGLHAIDVAQTVQIARNPPCYYEADPITSRLIGEHPSERDVLIWGVASGVFMHYASKKADESGGWKRAAWYAAAIVMTGRAVIGNHNIGLRVDGANCPR